MRIVAFSPEHLQAINLQKAQQNISVFQGDPDYAAVLDQGEAYTALDDNGDVLICAGLLPVWEGKAVIWAVLSERAGKAMIAIHRAAKRLVETAPYRRIEATVDCDFAEAHRWMRMLGFSMEAERMRAFDPEGRDYALYARVRC